MHVEQLTGPVVYHGEGPVWSMTWGGLRWLDMLAGDIMSMGTDGSIGRPRLAVPASPRVKTPSDIRAMEVDWSAAAAKWDTAAEFLKTEFAAAE